MIADRDKMYWELWGGWQAGDDKLWVNSSDLLLQVMNDNNRSTSTTLSFWIPNTPHTSQLHSFITELFSEQTLLENRDGCREREKYSDKHLLVVLNLMQFRISSVYLCAKLHLFISSNRIWSRFVFRCFCLISALSVLVYISLIWMLNIRYSLFLACLSLAN